MCIKLLLLLHTRFGYLLAENDIRRDRRERTEHTRREGHFAKKSISLLDGKRHHVTPFTRSTRSILILLTFVYYSTTTVDYRRLPWPNMVLSRSSV